MVLSLGISEGAAPTHTGSLSVSTGQLQLQSQLETTKSSHTAFIPPDIQSCKAIPTVHMGFRDAVIPLIPYNLILLLSFKDLVVGSGLMT